MSRIARQFAFTFSRLFNGRWRSRSNISRYWVLLAIPSVGFISTSQADKKNDKCENLAYCRELRAFLRADQIEDDEEACRARGKPWNSYHSIAEYPTVIVFPESTNDVSNILKICNNNRIPVVAFGGGTSLEGQTLTPLRGLSLDFSRMKNIVKLNEDDLDITVQAGLGYVELNEILKDKGLWFPLDPGPGASIGGMCACRCSGSTAVRYGSMRENVISLEAVLSDGTIARTGSRARKSSAGYDLTRLFIGSEGTLAIVTEATLKLQKLPKVACALRVSFPGGVHNAALAAKESIQIPDISIARCEFMDNTMISIVNSIHGHEALAPLDTLLFEVTGYSLENLREKLEIIKSVVLKHGGTHLEEATDAEECRKLWKVRKESVWSVMSAYPDKDPMITDVCVPLSNLPIMIQCTKDEIKKSFLPCPIVAHAGDGNIHVIIMFDPSNPQEKAEAYRLSSFMVEKAQSLEGTCTGEHGVGHGKIQYLEAELGHGSLQTMGNIKKALDPNQILNPGKILHSKYTNICN